MCTHFTLVLHSQSAKRLVIMHALDNENENFLVDSKFVSKQVQGSFVFCPQVEQTLTRLPSSIDWLRM